MPKGVYKRTKLHKKLISAGRKGTHHSVETKNKLSKKKIGKNNPNWKGGIARYYSVHNWINKYHKKPKFCEICKQTNKTRYNWANISGKYKKNITDWKRLCVLCHRKFDKHGDKMRLSWKLRKSFKPTNQRI